MDDGDHPRVMALSPGSAQPAVHMIRTCLGGPPLRAFPRSLP